MSETKNTASSKEQHITKSILQALDSFNQNLIIKKLFRFSEGLAN